MSMTLDRLRQDREDGDGITPLPETAQKRPVEASECQDEDQKGSSEGVDGTLSTETHSPIESTPRGGMNRCNANQIRKYKK